MVLSSSVNADVEFRGSRDGKGRRKAVYKTFPWTTLATSLFTAQCTLDGWPIEVRLPGDPTNTKGTLHGLKQHEIEDIAKALDEDRISVLHWTEGKHEFIFVFMLLLNNSNSLGLHRPKKTIQKLPSHTH